MVDRDEQIGRPLITIFLGSRLIRGAAGYYTTDSATAADRNWTRNLDGIPNLKLAARVTDGNTPGKMEVDADVIPLPHYHGGKSLVMRMPALIRAIIRVVRVSDVVVIRLPSAIGMIAGVAARAYGRPTAVDVSGSAGEVLRAISKSPRKIWFLAWLYDRLMRRTVRTANVVRYVTRFTLQAKYPAARDACVISSSAAKVPYSMVVESPKPDGNDRPTVLSIGSMEQVYKGHDVLIQAIRIVAQNVPDVQLVLIGDGGKRSDLESLARRLGLSGNLRFAGNISDRATLVNLVDSAWVYVQPSLTEGLPRALVEAMSRGKACIGTDVGGIPELVAARYLVPPGQIRPLAELIERLLIDRDERLQNAGHALHVVKSHLDESLEGPREQWRMNVADLSRESH